MIRTLITNPMQPLCHRSDTWIIVGSGPGAPEQFAEALDRYGVGAVIATTNSGLNIVADPHVYWISDLVAVAQLVERIKTKPLPAECEVLTHARSYSRAHLIRHLVTAVYPVDLGPRMSWTANQLANGRTSGCYLTQIATLQGAKRIVLVGMAGYRSKPGGVHTDYFDGRQGVDRHNVTMASYGPVMQSLFDQNLTRQYIFMSPPAWPWQGRNVQVLQEVAA